MTTIPQDLADRLAAVERDVAALKERLDRCPPPGETPVERSAPLLRAARLSQPAIAAAARGVSPDGDT